MSHQTGPFRKAERATGIYTESIYLIEGIGKTSVGRTAPAKRGHG